MNALSPWAVSASAELAGNSSVRFELHADPFNFKVIATNDSIWIQTELPNGGRVSFRAAYSPGSNLEVVKSKQNPRQGIDLKLKSAIGQQKVTISVDQSEGSPVLRYTNSLIPVKDLMMPSWPKDILFNGKNNNPEQTEGKIHAGQFGTRTGFLYLSQIRPKSATLLYLQNLTALSEYAEQTETSLGDTVGGEWPELGFSLPPSKKPLPKGKEVILADAFIAFSEEVPEKEPDMIRLYLDLLARIYLLLPKPQTAYKHWPDILDKGLKDLIDSPGCWSQVNGHKYFNAYVSDYETPPEIMVQLAVLLPLLDYVEWSEKELEVMKTIKAGLPSFYDKKLGTIMRWLPAAEDKLKGEEEQKVPKVMDSWYLHHPLLNLSRLALKGDKMATQLFLDSLDFAIRVAHHFKYQWPVFYKMDTLEVVKAETAEGKGGEKDVAGIYAHVMLQAWELTAEQRYLKEAEKAAKTLQGLGFKIFYQANNTAFSSGALFRLYKITKNELYLELSYMCLAGIFRNVQLWDCNYGYGKNFPKFFSLYPLNDAPYTAVYEEQEVFCAFHDYLKHAEDVDILPSVKLLIAEYIRYLVDRAVYYYPTMLPADMLEVKPKIGEVDPKLWIALEDLQDGWLKSGTVGQEVYGAGNAFGIMPRHYLQIPGLPFMIYTDYPTSGFNARKGKNISFKILGDKRISCRMMLVKTASKKIPEFQILLKGQKEPLKASTVANGNLEYIIPGDSSIIIHTHLSKSI
ncbi:hypothetical protein [Pedobacter heparinus]|uniref:Uncharacterized protein n=1 Tax=Pedobacter heparinus (strain ATCC 13125 / DSM 2366 / CIP 104194 / JCM 7457 / NBRC 12017 / NCIMB 9290 / NRRL B-14731 / HIM 762-3) TaxID=485917 RepID=C6XVS4_PEDHD|nr:hypothetical protein [Pedobacter heparinus]ACU06149.1 hypothetical protein Phep_3958 [Pedobacter heparinus DSM 2366]